MAILHVFPTSTPDGPSRFGLALPKRIAPRSVDRNRLKRVAREAFRKHPAKLAGADLVLAPRERFTPEGEAALLAEIGRLLDLAAAEHA